MSEGLPLLDRAFFQSEQVAPLGRRVLEEAANASGASAAALWVTSTDGEHLDGALNHGDRGLESLSVPVADSVVGMVAVTGTASCIGPDDYHNPSVDEKLGTTTEAMAAVPVYVADELCGVLSAINPTKGGLFNAKQLERLQWKAYLLGLIAKDERDRSASLE